MYTSHSSSMVAGQACIVYCRPSRAASIFCWNTPSHTQRTSNFYKDAMSREDRQSWAEAHDKEYSGFKERNAFKIIRPEKGIKMHDTLTRLEYKEDNGTLHLL